MAYNTQKNTTNPFIPKVIEKLKELTNFKGESIVEKIVKCLSQFIVLLILIALIPIGAVISIYNSFYNLQKKTYDNLINDKDSTSNQFASSVEFGVYFVLSLPFLFLLIPYWIIAAIVTWFAKNKTVAIILIIIAVVAYIFRQNIIDFFVSLNLTAGKS